MAMMVPDDVRRLFLVLTGEEWPDADEDRLRVLADAWDTAAQRLSGELAPELLKAVVAIRATFDGETERAFVAKMSPYVEGDDNYISAASEQFRWLAKYLRDLAVDVEYVKLVSILSIGALIVEIAWASAAAYATGGASLEWLAERVAVVRTLLQTAAGRLAIAFAQAEAVGMAFQAAIDVLAQSIQFAMGTRHTWNTSYTTNAFAVGALGGVLMLPLTKVGQVLAHVAEQGLETALAKFAKFAKTIPSWAHTVPELVSEIGVEAFHEVFTESLYNYFTTGEWNMNVFSATSGGFSGIGGAAGRSFAHNRSTGGAHGAHSLPAGATAEHPAAHVPEPRTTDLTTSHPLIDVPSPGSTSVRATPGSRVEAIPSTPAPTHPNPASPHLTVTTPTPQTPPGHGTAAASTPDHPAAGRPTSPTSSTPVTTTPEHSPTTHLSPEQPAATHSSPAQPSTTPPSVAPSSSAHSPATPASTSQPSAVQPSTGHPSTTPLSTGHPSPTRLSVEHPASANSSTTHSSLDQPAAAQSASTRPPVAQPSTAQSSTTPPSTTHSPATHASPAQPTVANSSTAQLSTGHPSTTPLSTGHPSVAELSAVPPSVAQPSVAHPSPAELSAARAPSAPSSPTQPSTAPLSTAPPSITQPSTAQPTGAPSHSAVAQPSVVGAGVGQPVGPRSSEVLSSVGQSLVEPLSPGGPSIAQPGGAQTFSAPQPAVARTADTQASVVPPSSTTQPGTARTPSDRTVAGQDTTARTSAPEVSEGVLGQGETVTAEAAAGIPDPARTIVHETLTPEEVPSESGVDGATWARLWEWPKPGEFDTVGAGVAEPNVPRTAGEAATVVDTWRREVDTLVTTARTYQQAARDELVITKRAAEMAESVADAALGRLDQGLGPYRPIDPGPRSLRDALNGLDQMRKALRDHDNHISRIGQELSQLQSTTDGTRTHDDVRVLSDALAVLVPARNSLRLRLEALRPEADIATETTEAAITAATHVTAAEAAIGDIGQAIDTLVDLAGQVTSAHGILVAGTPDFLAHMTAAEGGRKLAETTLGSVTGALQEANKAAAGAQQAFARSTLERSTTLLRDLPLAGDIGVVRVDEQPLGDVGTTLFGTDAEAARQVTKSIGESLRDHLSEVVNRGREITVGGTRVWLAAEVFPPGDARLWAGAAPPRHAHPDVVDIASTDSQSARTATSTTNHATRLPITMTELLPFLRTLVSMGLLSQGVEVAATSTTSRPGLRAGNRSVVDARVGIVATRLDNVRLAPAAAIVPVRLRVPLVVPTSVALPAVAQAASALPGVGRRVTFQLPSATAESGRVSTSSDDGVSSETSDDTTSSSLITMSSAGAPTSAPSSILRRPTLGGLTATTRSELAAGAQIRVPHGLVQEVARSIAVEQTGAVGELLASADLLGLPDNGHLNREIGGSRVQVTAGGLEVSLVGPSSWVVEQRTGSTATGVALSGSGAIAGLGFGGGHDNGTTRWYAGAFGDLVTQQTGGTSLANEAAVERYAAHTTLVYQVDRPVVVTVGTAPSVLGRVSGLVSLPVLDARRLGLPVPDHLSPGNTTERPGAGAVYRIGRDDIVAVPGQDEIVEFLGEGIDETGRAAVRAAFADFPKAVTTLYNSMHGGHQVTWQAGGRLHVLDIRGAIAPPEETFPSTQTRSHIQDQVTTQYRSVAQVGRDFKAGLGAEVRDTLTDGPGSGSRGGPTSLLPRVNLGGAATRTVTTSVGTNSRDSHNTTYEGVFRGFNGDLQLVVVHSEVVLPTWLQHNVFFDRMIGGPRAADRLVEPSVTEIRAAFTEASRPGIPTPPRNGEFARGKRVSGAVVVSTPNDRLPVADRAPAPTPGFVSGIYVGEPPPLPNHVRAHTVAPELFGRFTTVDHVRVSANTREALLLALAKSVQVMGTTPGSRWFRGRREQTLRKSPPGAGLWPSWGVRRAEETRFNGHPARVLRYRPSALTRPGADSAEVIRQFVSQVGARGLAVLGLNGEVSGPHPLLLPGTFTNLAGSITGRVQYLSPRVVQVRTNHHLHRRGDGDKPVNSVSVRQAGVDGNLTFLSTPGRTTEWGAQIQLLLSGNRRRGQAMVNELTPGSRQVLHYTGPTVWVALDARYTFTGEVDVQTMLRTNSARPIEVTVDEAEALLVEMPVATAAHMFATLGIDAPVDLAFIDRTAPRPNPVPGSQQLLRDRAEYVAYGPVAVFGSRLHTPDALAGAGTRLTELGVGGKWRQKVLDRLTKLFTSPSEWVNLKDVLGGERVLSVPQHGVFTTDVVDIRITAVPSTSGPGGRGAAAEPVVPNSMTTYTYASSTRATQVNAASGYSIGLQSTATMTEPGTSVETLGAAVGIGGQVSTVETVPGSATRRPMMMATYGKLDLSPHDVTYQLVITRRQTAMPLLTAVTLTAARFFNRVYGAAAAPVLAHGSVELVSPGHGTVPSMSRPAAAPTFTVAEGNRTGAVSTGPTVLDPKAMWYIEHLGSTTTTAIRDAAYAQLGSAPLVPRRPDRGQAEVAAAAARTSRYTDRSWASEPALHALTAGQSLYNGAWEIFTGDAYSAREILGPKHLLHEETFDLHVRARLVPGTFTKVSPGPDAAPVVHGREIEEIKLQGMSRVAAQVRGLSGVAQSTQSFTDGGVPSEGTALAQVGLDTTVARQVADSVGEYKVTLVKQDGESYLFTADAEYQVHTAAGKAAPPGASRPATGTSTTVGITVHQDVRIRVWEADALRAGLITLTDVWDRAGVRLPTPPSGAALTYTAAPDGLVVTRVNAPATGLPAPVEQAPDSRGRTLYLGPGVPADLVLDFVRGLPTNQQATQHIALPDPTSPPSPSTASTPTNAEPAADIQVDDGAREDRGLATLRLVVPPDTVYSDPRDWVGLVNTAPLGLRRQTDGNAAAAMFQSTYHGTPAVAGQSTPPAHPANRPPTPIGSGTAALRQVLDRVGQAEHGTTSIVTAHTPTDTYTWNVVNHHGEVLIFDPVAGTWTDATRIFNPPGIPGLAPGDVATFTAPDVIPNLGPISAIHLDRYNNHLAPDPRQHSTETEQPAIQESAAHRPVGEPPLAGPDAPRPTPPLSTPPEGAPRVPIARRRGLAPPPPIDTSRPGEVGLPAMDPDTRLAALRYAVSRGPVDPLGWVHLVNGEALGTNPADAARAFHSTYRGEPVVVGTRSGGVRADARWAQQPMEDFGTGPGAFQGVIDRVVRGGRGSAAIVYDFRSGELSSWNVVYHHDVVRVFEPRSGDYVGSTADALGEVGSVFAVAVDAHDNRLGAELMSDPRLAQLREIVSAGEKFTHPASWLSLIRNTSGYSGSASAFNASMAVLATYHGEPVVEGAEPSRMPAWAEHDLEDFGAGPDAVQRVIDRVARGGHGSAAIVSGYVEGEEEQGWWNVINHNGELLLITPGENSIQLADKHVLGNPVQLYAIPVDANGNFITGLAPASPTPGLVSVSAFSDPRVWIRTGVDPTGATDAVEASKKFQLAYHGYSAGVNVSIADIHNAPNWVGAPMQPIGADQHALRGVINGVAAAPPGSAAIVRFLTVGDNRSHTWNVVNHGGEVLILDAAAGTWTDATRVFQPESDFVDPHVIADIGTVHAIRLDETNGFIDIQPVLPPAPTDRAVALESMVRMISESHLSESLKAKVLLSSYLPGGAEAVEWAEPRLEAFGSGAPGFRAVLDRVAAGGSGAEAVVVAQVDGLESGVWSAVNRAGEVWLFDLGTGSHEPATAHKVGNSAYLYAIALDPDGNHLAAEQRAHTAEVEAGRKLLLLRGWMPTGNSRSIHFGHWLGLVNGAHDTESPATNSYRSAVAFHSILNGDLVVVGAPGNDIKQVADDAWWNQEPTESFGLGVEAVRKVVDRVAGGGYGSDAIMVGFHMDKGPQYTWNVVNHEGTVYIVDPRAGTYELAANSTVGHGLGTVRAIPMDAGNRFIQPRLATTEFVEEPVEQVDTVDVNQRLVTLQSVVGSQYVDPNLWVESMWGAEGDQSAGVEPFDLVKAVHLTYRGEPTVVGAGDTRVGQSAAWTRYPMTDVGSGPEAQLALLTAVARAGWHASALAISHNGRGQSRAWNLINHYGEILFIEPAAHHIESLDDGTIPVDGRMWVLPLDAQNVYINLNAAPDRHISRIVESDPRFEALRTMVPVSGRYTDTSAWAGDDIVDLPAGAGLAEIGRFAPLPGVPEAGVPGAASLSWSGYPMVDYGAGRTAQRNLLGLVTTRGHGAGALVISQRVGWSTWDTWTLLNVNGEIVLADPLNGRIGPLSEHPFPRLGRTLVLELADPNAVSGQVTARVDSPAAVEADSPVVDDVLRFEWTDEFQGATVDYDSDASSVAVANLPDSGTLQPDAIVVPGAVPPGGRMERLGSADTRHTHPREWAGSVAAESTSDIQSTPFDHAMAAHSVWQGQPAVVDASDSHGTRPATWTNHPLVDFGTGPTAQRTLVDLVADAGHGAGALVVSQAEAGAQAWNLVNHNDEVLFVDPLTGDHGPAATRPTADTESIQALPLDANNNPLDPPVPTEPASASTRLAEVDRARSDLAQVADALTGAPRRTIMDRIAALGAYRRRVIAEQLRATAARGGVITLPDDIGILVPHRGGWVLLSPTPAAAGEIAHYATVLDGQITAMVVGADLDDLRHLKFPPRGRPLPVEDNPTDDGPDDGPDDNDPTGDDGPTAGDNRTAGGDSPGDDDPAAGDDAPGDDDPTAGDDAPGDDDPTAGDDSPGDDDPTAGDDAPGDDDPAAGNDSPGEDGSPAGDGSTGEDGFDNADGSGRGDGGATGDNLADSPEPDTDPSSVTRPGPAGSSVPWRRRHRGRPAMADIT
ncbi:toxin glutamine deamidase domain-containing protein [Actinokineospora inagensis]|uniref:toxin glutamine deamidase domain-containing protein n=1 Tax=Actinokineospora inagensis TaxID=103730 RepID=UPI00042009F8|nr:toxin glutamine deamidase domain-containing protein [Actinokineospora inagensis]